MKNKVLELATKDYHSINIKSIAHTTNVAYISVPSGAKSVDTSNGEKRDRCVCVMSMKFVLRELHHKRWNQELSFPMSFNPVTYDTVLGYATLCSCSCIISYIHIHFRFSLQLINSMISSFFSSPGDSDHICW